MKGLKIKESPDWLKKNRLEKIGLGSINAVVDITVTTTYDPEEGPLHAYNSDLISKNIGARLAKAEVKKLKR